MSNRAPAPAETLPVTGDLTLVEAFNLNGIVQPGRWLLAVQSATGTLVRIDPATGVATAVDLGGYSLTNGDGLEPDGDLLHVVRNRDNLVATLRLDDDRAAGVLVAEPTDDDFDVTEARCSRPVHPRHTSLPRARGSHVVRCRGPARDRGGRTWNQDFPGATCCGRACCPGPGSWWPAASMPSRRRERRR